MNENKRFDLFESMILNDEEKKIIQKVETVSDIIFQIVKKRIDLNLTQRDLALKTGIKQPMIARIEALKTIPRLDTLITIINELGLELKTIDKENDMKTININLNFNITTIQNNPYIINNQFTKIDNGGTLCNIA